MYLFFGGIGHEKQKLQIDISSIGLQDLSASALVQAKSDKLCNRILINLRTFCFSLLQD